MTAVTDRHSIDNLHDVQPVHRLPPELLAMIFIDLQPRRRSRYNIPFEVAMSHVCTRWRDIALGTPLLWTNIDVYSVDCVGCVTSYLERSHNCSIDVRFDVWQSDRHLDPEAGAKILPLVDIVLQHIARWRTLLVFASHATTATSILMKMADMSAPLLQRMRIVDDEDVDDDQHITDTNQALSLKPRILTGGAPRLSALRVDRLCCLPPLANVTTLHLRTHTYFLSSEMNTQVLSELSAACPSLSALSIHGNFRDAWLGDKITMSSLRSLWFYNGDTLAAKFLTAVSLPNLESLWLDCPQYRVIQAVATAHPQPTFPALKYLTLQSFDFYASSQFAKAFPTITALHLSYCNSFHVTFLKETLAEHEFSRWPHLTTLVFRTTRETHAKKLSKTLDEIVADRHAGRNPIRVVLVDKDILATLGPHADSLREKTALDLLRADNFDEPWWLMSHMDMGDRL